MADEKPGEGMDRSEEEKRHLQDEIEEILRGKGEQPGRARRPRPPRPALPSVPAALVGLLRYLLVLGVMGVLLFLSVRVLGPRGLVFTFWALFIFFFFYAIRGLLQDILRRRR